LQIDSVPGTRSEAVNCVTHALGLALSLSAVPLLIFLAASRGTAWHIVGVSVYGATLIMLYTASTIYHACRAERLRKVFQVLDHSSIYLLIAGTYTPFALVNLRGPWGWTLLGLVWGIAIFGITWKIVAASRWPAVSIASYLLMGWLAVIAIKPLMAAVHFGGIVWLLAGGLTYTLGTLFYGWKKLPYHHAVWHVLVIAGSICHYLAIAKYVLP
jgi:hemolysin III